MSAFLSALAVWVMGFAVGLALFRIAFPLAPSPVWFRAGRDLCRRDGWFAYLMVFPNPAVTPEGEELRCAFYFEAHARPLRLVTVPLPVDRGALIHSASWTGRTTRTLVDSWPKLLLRAGRRAA